jgi:acyl carrier protein
MPDLAPDSVLAELQPIFQEALDNPALTVTRSSSARDTPNWDSLAHIEIIDMVERRFKVRFDLGEVQDLQTVGDLVDLTIKSAHHG